MHGSHSVTPPAPGRGAGMEVGRPGGEGSPDRPLLREVLLRQLRTWTTRFWIFVPSEDWMLIGDEQVALPWNW